MAVGTEKNNLISRVASARVFFRASRTLSARQAICPAHSSGKRYHVPPQASNEPRSSQQENLPTPYARVPSRELRVCRPGCALPLLSFWRECVERWGEEWERVEAEEAKAPCGTGEEKVGLALVLALVVGVATTALAADPGDSFRLGQANTVDAMTRLTSAINNPVLGLDNNSANAAATALELRVEPGKAPMEVNSDAKVASLNADEVDGESADEIGVNGWERAEATSVTNALSPKSATARCPSGKVVVGTGAEITCGKLTNPGTTHAYRCRDRRDNFIRIQAVRHRESV